MPSVGVESEEEVNPYRHVGGGALYAPSPSVFFLLFIKKSKGNSYLLIYIYILYYHILDICEHSYENEFKEKFYHLSEHFCFGSVKEVRRER